MYVKRFLVSAPNVVMSGILLMYSPTFGFASSLISLIPAKRLQLSRTRLVSTSPPSRASPSPRLLLLWLSRNRLLSSSSLFPESSSRPLTIPLRQVSPPSPLWLLVAGPAVVCGPFLLGLVVPRRIDALLMNYRLVRCLSSRSSPIRRIKCSGSQQVSALRADLACRVFAPWTTGRRDICHIISRLDLEGVRLAHAMLGHRPRLLRRLNSVVLPTVVIVLHGAKSICTEPPRVWQGRYGPAVVHTCWRADNVIVR